jgi:Reverse transcriptase (RNA-dependent DNA polymerase)
MDRRGTRTGPGPCRPIGWQLVPKPTGGTRRLVVLDPQDEMAFSRIVIKVAPAIRRSLGAASHANRLVRWDPQRGALLEPWRRARRRWHGDVRRLGSRGRFVALTDVRACYASIAPDVIAGRLRMLGAPPAQVEEIASWLRAFGDAGVHGLPVGPVGSALLADAVLAVGDHALRTTGAGFVRWVDDVAIFAPDRRARASAIGTLREAWGSLGLEMHERKTLLLDDPRDMTAVAATSNVSSRISRWDNRAT